MRILQIHNQYDSKSPSGENITVARIATELEHLGEDVVRFWPSSDALRTFGGKARNSLSPFGVGPTRRELESEVKGRGIDVALLHNVYPQLSPGIVEMLSRNGIPTVHVVHNFRHTCIKGSHWRDGKDCHLCDPRTIAGRAMGVRHRCYRGSGPQSLILASAESFGHNAWSRVVRVVAISKFMMKNSGTQELFDSVPHEVIYNPVDRPPVVADGWRPDYMYVGRLAEEKGLGLLLDAWKTVRVPGTLHIVGDGPLRDQIRQFADSDQTVRFHGLLDQPAVQRMRVDVGTALITPLWNEPFGRVAAEALASRQLVIGTAVGALPEILEGVGIIAPAGSAGLEASLRTAARISSTEAIDKGHERWEYEFSPSVVGKKYQRVLQLARKEN